MWLAVCAMASLRDARGTRFSYCIRESTAAFSHLEDSREAHRSAAGDGCKNSCARVRTRAAGNTMPQKVSV